MHGVPKCTGTQLPEGTSGLWCVIPLGPCEEVTRPEIRVFRWSYAVTGAACLVLYTLDSQILTLLVTYLTGFFPLDFINMKKKMLRNSKLTFCNKKYVYF